MTAFTRLGRRLRLGLLGGGPGSFIGPIHRAAARLDDRFELIAGVLSSHPDIARAAAADLGIAGHASIEAMLAAGHNLDAVAIMTPNDRHLPECLAALAAGLDVICDKPLANTLADARAIQTAAAGRVFCLTHAYAGYPMLRQAAAMVEAGTLGALRAIQVEYLQAGMSARVEDGPTTAKLRWKLDPARAGASLVLGDIGTHAFHLARMVGGRRLQRLAADLGALVPGRTAHDYGAFLLRFEGDVHGTMTVSQALAGTENAITLRIFGADGHLEWTHARNNHLTLALQTCPLQILARGDHGLLPPAKRLVRIARGHPEGFLEAFANLYRDAAEAIAARITGTAPDPLASFPTADDGVEGLEFIDAALRSRAQGGDWIEV
jgi:predicted dehydrogenase